MLCTCAIMASAQESPEKLTDFKDAEPFSLSAQGLDLTFYPAGKDRLEALLELIGSARESIRIFSYFFASDAIGELVRERLIEAAGRGVEVQVIVDSFGSQPDAEFFAPLVEAGGSYAVFSPRRDVSYLIRNHQKIAIADDTVAIIGGFNITRTYFDPPQVNGWNDLGVRVSGDAVKGLVDWYALLAAWTVNPKAQFRAMRKLVREWEPGEGPVQWLIGGPSRISNSWARRVREDLRSGRRLDLVMAYFSPSGTIRRLIEKIASHGRTTLVLAGKSDNGATIGAARSLYRKLMRSGARIYEFEACKLHTKMLVVDDVSYFGSANFDMRSLRLNLELMLRIEDAALAERLREYLATLIAGSIEVTPELHRGRATWWNRLRWRASWFLVTVLDYTVTRRLNLGL